MPDNPEDKRRRNNSLGNELPQPIIMDIISMLELKLSMDMILAKLSLTALAEDMKGLASKEDLKRIDDQMTTQNHEIGQLKDEVKILKGNLETLQANVDKQYALNLVNGSGSMGHDPGSNSFNMAPRSVNNPCAATPQQRNLIIEGLNGDPDPEIITGVLKIADAIGVTLYAKEIEQVFRLNRRDEADTRPGPVSVTLTRAILRDNMLRKKGDLQKVEEFKGIFVNADEPIQIRKAKLFLRKAAFQAKKQGENVLFKHNEASINGVRYDTESYDKIPAKYLVNERSDEKAREKDQVIDISEEPMEASGGIKTPDTKEGIIKPGERMKIRSKGLCFSGPSAYISNMAYSRGLKLDISKLDQDHLKYRGHPSFEH